MRMTPLGGHSPYDHHVRSAVHRNHPPLAQIMKHSAARRKKPTGSRPALRLERNSIAASPNSSSIRLSKPDARDLEESEPILDSSGQQIGERYSPRKRFVPKRRGGPEEFRIRTRLHSRSERRPHVGGALGTALLRIALKIKWVIQDLDGKTEVAIAA
jgi:hypothetical protein